MYAKSRGYATVLEAGGKPSTWLPPGRLVEHLQKTSTNKEKQASEQTNKRRNWHADKPASKQVTNKGKNE